MKFLLDTNVISELRKGARANPGVARWGASQEPDDQCTSVLVLGEIRRGIERKRRIDAAQGDMLERWYLAMRTQFGGRVLPVDERVADVWGRIGRRDPVPEIDGLLAATAKVHGLVFVTRNSRDIERTGVRFIDPFET